MDDRESTQGKAHAVWIGAGWRVYRASFAFRKLMGRKNWMVAKQAAAINLMLAHTVVTRLISLHGRNLPQLRQRDAPLALENINACMHFSQWTLPDGKLPRLTEAWTSRASCLET